MRGGKLRRSGNRLANPVVSGLVLKRASGKAFEPARELLSSELF
jgi:hypothetical protein